MNRSSFYQEFCKLENGSYFSPAFFCLGIIKLEEIFSKQYSCFKNDNRQKFSWYVHNWCKGLVALARLSDKEDFWSRQVDKLEPSEIAFLTDIRNQEFFSSLSLDQEVYIYKSFNKLFR